MLPVLYLHPIGRPTGAIWPVLALRDQPLKPKLAVDSNMGADAGYRGAREMAAIKASAISGQACRKYATMALVFLTLSHLFGSDALN
jgi:hypothetical protein